MSLGSDICDAVFSPEPGHELPYVRWDDKLEELECRVEDEIRHHEKLAETARANDEVHGRIIDLQEFLESLHFVRETYEHILK